MLNLCKYMFLLKSNDNNNPIITFWWHSFFFILFRLFGGLVLDIKRKVPFLLSDFTDAFSLQCLASFLFLYCACMSPVITFGGLLGEATDGRIVCVAIGFAVWPHLFVPIPIPINKMFWVAFSKDRFPSHSSNFSILLFFFLNTQSAIESLFGASMTGIAYSLFGGQPLTILGSTGPVLVFEKILFKFCK